MVSAACCHKALLFASIHKKIKCFIDFAQSVFCLFVCLFVLASTVVQIVYLGHSRSSGSDTRVPKTKLHTAMNISKVFNVLSIAGNSDLQFASTISLSRGGGRSFFFFFFFFFFFWRGGGGGTFASTISLSRGGGRSLLLYRGNVSHKGPAVPKSCVSLCSPGVRTTGVPPSASVHTPFARFKGSH